MGGIFQKASRLAQILLASSIPYLKAEPINWELSSGKKESTQQETVLRHRDNAEEVKKNNVKINAGLNSAGNEFTFEYFTEDFDRQDWKRDETEKVVPIYRHTPLSPDMQILVRHPDTVVVGETKQKKFMIPEYRWENSIPFEEHKTAQAVFGLIERGVVALEERYLPFWLGSSGIKFLVGYDTEKRYGNVFGEGENPKEKLMFQVVDRGLGEIFSRLPDLEFIPEELTGKVQEAVGEKLKDRYAEIFEEEYGKREVRKGYSTTRIPIHLPPKNFMRFSTAYSLTIPFSGKLSEDDEVTFWADPAFGDSSSQSGQNSYPIGFARADEVRIKLNLNLEKRTESKPIFATSPKTLEWYIPTEEDMMVMIEDKRKTAFSPKINQRYNIKTGIHSSFIFLEDRKRKIPFFELEFQDDNSWKIFEEHFREEDLQSSILISNPPFLVFFDYNDCLSGLTPEQNRDFFGFLVRYHNRVGGDIFYPYEMRTHIEKMVPNKTTGGVNQEEINKAILKIWERKK